MDRNFLLLIISAIISSKTIKTLFISFWVVIINIFVNILHRIWIHNKCVWIIYMPYSCIFMFFNQIFIFWCTQIFCIQMSFVNNECWMWWRFLHKKYQDHFPCSFAYKFVCIDDRFTKPTVAYRGENAAYEFIRAILQEHKYCRKIRNKHFNKNLIMSEKEEHLFNKVTVVGFVKKFL